MQAILGAIPIEFTKYWTQRFPYLVSHAFHALESCSHENLFKNYYSDSFTYAQPDYFYQHTEEFVPHESAPKLQRDSPAKKYSKEMRQRQSQEVSLDTRTANGGDFFRPFPPNKRGSFNFYKSSDGKVVNEAVAKDNELNWRRPKNTPKETIAWTLSNANE